MSPLPHLVVGGLTAPLLASLLDAMSGHAQVHSACILSVLIHIENSVLGFDAMRAVHLRLAANSPLTILGCMRCDDSVACVLKPCCTSTPPIQCLCSDIPPYVVLGPCWQQHG